MTQRSSDHDDRGHFDFTGWPADGRVYCDPNPHLQSWSMMQFWGVKRRPRWQREYIQRVNNSVRTFRP